MNPLSATDPTVIASYRLLGVLGSGGMGRVYLAQSPTGRRLAIKVIRADLAENPVFRHRFAHEVAAVRTVNPLFTAAVVDADTGADPPWLATTYIDGPSLEHWVAEHGPMAPTAVLTLAAGLAEALASIHRAGLVHRDLKPGNVLLDDAGPHIIDFGIALTAESTRITTSLVGTPSYMAPERLRGAEAAPLTDVFSLGATLFFAATGRRLAAGDSVYEQLMQMTAGRFDLSAVPARVRPVIARCVSRRARDRPSAAELTRLLSPPDVRTPGPGWYRRDGATDPAGAEPTTIRLSRRRAVALGGALTVAAVGGGVGLAAVLLTGASSRGAPGASGGRSPGAPLLWQVRSGAAALDTGADPWIGTARIAVDPSGRIVTSNAPQVFAMDTRGRRVWSRTLSAGPFGVRLWGDGVLVTDSRRAWLLDAATGAGRFEVDLAGAEEAALATDPGQVRIRQVALSTDRAVLDLSGTVIAIDRTGRRLWRRPAAAPVGTPASGHPSATARPAGTSPADPPSLAGLAAEPDRVLTTARTGSTAWVALYAAGTGAVRWSTRYDLPPLPTQRPIPPPDGSGPPGGPPRFPDGPPPGPPGGGMTDAVWQWSEAKLGDDFVALRHAQSVHVRRASDGSPVWQRTSPAPVAGIEVVGDLLLVAADRLTAYSLATQATAWQASLPGVRLAGSADGRTVVATTGREICVLDRAGALRWRADLPDSVDYGVPDRLTVAGRTAYLTLQPPTDLGGTLDADVLAIDLDGAV